MFAVVGDAAQVEPEISRQVFTAHQQQQQLHSDSKYLNWTFSKNSDNLLYRFIHRIQRVYISVQPASAPLKGTADA